MPIRTPFTEMLGCGHPIQQAAMGGSASIELAVSVAEGGGLGMLSGTVGADALRKQLDAAGHARPIGVNFLVPFLDLSALEPAAESGYVELFWGEPDEGVVARIHSAGSLAGWQVGSGDEARAAVDAGCDVVVAQGVEAGGHVRGELGLLPLLEEVRRHTSGVVLAAGGIGSGRAVAAALVAGADGVRVGTRFVAAEESKAHPAYVEALIAAGVGDTTVTTAFGDGWPDAPHRVLRSAIEAGRALGASQRWRPDWPDVSATGPIGSRALYAGQSVAGVRSRQPAREIIAELMVEAEEALRSRGGGVRPPPGPVGGVGAPGLKPPRDGSR